MAQYTHGSSVSAFINKSTHLRCREERSNNNTYLATRLTEGAIAEFIAAAKFPYTPVERVAATILCVATHPERSTSGLPWTLPDGGEVFRLPVAGLNQGVYAVLNERARDAVLAMEKAFLAPVKPKL